MGQRLRESKPSDYFNAVRRSHVQTGVWLVVVLWKSDIKRKNNWEENLCKTKTCGRRGIFKTKAADLYRQMYLKKTRRPQGEN